MRNILIGQMAFRISKIKRGISKKRNALKVIVLAEIQWWSPFCRGTALVSDFAGCFRSGNHWAVNEENRAAGVCGVVT